MRKLTPDLLNRLTNPGQKNPVEQAVLNQAIQLVTPLATGPSCHPPVVVGSGRGGLDNLSMEGNLYKGPDNETEAAVRNLLALDPQLTSYREPDLYTTGTTESTVTDFDLGLVRQSDTHESLSDSSHASSNSSSSSSSNSSSTNTNSSSSPGDPLYSSTHRLIQSLLRPQPR